MTIRQVHHKLDNVTASTRVPVCTGFRVVELANRSLNFEPHVIENCHKNWKKLFYREMIRFPEFVLNNHNFFAKGIELQASLSYTWITRNMVRSWETSVTSEWET